MRSYPLSDDGRSLKPGVHGRVLHYFLHIALLALLYLLFARVSSIFSIAGAYTVPLWLPAGIAYVYVLRYGLPVAIGAGLGNLLHTVLFAHSMEQWSDWIAPALIGISASAQAMAAVYLTRPLYNAGLMDSSRRIFRILLLAGPFSCVIAASIGVLSLWHLDAAGTGEWGRHWWIWYSGDVLGVWLVTPVTLLWQSRLSLLRKLYVTLPTALVCMSTLAISHSVQEAQFGHLHSRVERERDHILDHLQSEAMRMSALVETIGVYAKARLEFDLQQFDADAKALLGRLPYLHAISWYTVIQGSDRERLQNVLLSRYGSEVTIQTRHKGRLQPAADSIWDGMLAPLTYRFPPDRTSLGQNAFSSEELAAAMQRAHSQGGVSLAAPIRTTVGGDSTLTFLLAVYGRTGSPSELRGFAAVTVADRDLLGPASQTRTSDEWAVELTDVTEAHSPFILARDGQPSTAPELRNLRSVRQINVFGRTWELAISPEASFAVLRLTGLSTAVVELSSLLTLTLFLLLISETARFSRITRQASTAARLLDQSENRYRLLFESMQHGIFEVDAKGGIQLANPAFRAITATCSRAANPTWSELFHAEDRRLADGLIRQFFADGQPVEPTELRLNTGEDAKPDWAEISMHQVRPAGEGRPETVTGILSDISERKRLDKLRNDFVSSISHELRTPLTAIRASLQLLVHGTLGRLPEAAGEILSLALRNTNRLINLVNNLLDLQKLDAGKLSVRVEPCNLLKTVQRSVETFTPAAVESGITILFAEPAGTQPETDSDIPPRSPAESPCVLADPLRLTQVVDNLLSNAIKFSRSDGPDNRVVVSIQPNESFWRISVRDFGVGVDPKIRRHLFKRFAQGRNLSDLKPIAGTGLGLSICRELVDAMHGRIHYSSVPGQGSAFHVDIPVCKTEQK